MSYKNLSNNWILPLLSVLLFTACNEEWEGEQYENYLAFINSGVTKVYIKYAEKGGKVNYQFPVQVTGTTLPEHDLNVKVVVDTDTIDGYNKETFRLREDLFYKPLPEKHYELNPLTVIKADSARGFIDVDFNFQDLDLYDNYLLALSIDPSSDLQPHPRKYYKKTLIHINLFNDFSGRYSVAENTQYDAGNNNWEDLAVDNRNSWVVDENTIFFYAGVTNEDALDRKDYRVYVEFIPYTEEELEEKEGDGNIRMWSDNPEIDFKFDGGYYTLAEVPDVVQPYLKRKYVYIMTNYNYLDLTIPNHPIRYRYDGSMVMERVINTLMPEEYQVQWED